MSDQPSKIIPNTFQFPNALLDDGLMALLTGAETKCYLVVVRKTFGWHKRSDRIAKSQLIELTGLGVTAIETSMANLVRFGLVLRVAENNAANQGIEWALQTDDSLTNWSELMKRDAEIDRARQRQTQNARKALKPIPMGGEVQQPHPVGPPLGGEVQQPTQKPLSKATKEQEEEERAAKKNQFSAELTQALQNAGIFVMIWPKIEERLRNGWSEDDVKAVLNWMSSQNRDPAKSAQRAVARIREGSKAPAQYYPEPDEPDQADSVETALPEPEFQLENAGNTRSSVTWPISSDDRMTPQLAWNHALDQLQLELPKPSFDNYVRDARLFQYDVKDGIFRVEVMSVLTREWLESRLTKTVSRLLLGICNRPVSVEWVVPVSVETA